MTSNSEASEVSEEIRAAAHFWASRLNGDAALRPILNSGSTPGFNPITAEQKVRFEEELGRLFVERWLDEADKTASLLTRLDYKAPPDIELAAARTGIEFIELRLPNKMWTRIEPGRVRTDQGTVFESEFERWSRNVCGAMSERVQVRFPNSKADPGFGRTPWQVAVPLGAGDVARIVPQPDHGWIMQWEGSAQGPQSLGTSEGVDELVERIEPLLYIRSRSEELQRELSEVGVLVKSELPGGRIREIDAVGDPSSVWRLEVPVRRDAAIDLTFGLAGWMIQERVLDSSFGYSPLDLPDNATLQEVASQVLGHARSLRDTRAALERAADTLEEASWRLARELHPETGEDEFLFGRAPYLSIEVEGEVYRLHAGLRDWRIVKTAGGNRLLEGPCWLSPTAAVEDIASLMARIGREGWPKAEWDRR